jgi:prolyl-tRNA synthetase
MEKVATPGKMACTDVAACLSVELTQIVKSIAVVSDTEDEKKIFALLLLRGDHELNEIKAGKIPALGAFRLATESEVIDALGCIPGYIGPVAVDREKVAIFADRTVAAMSDFVCGANEAGFHLTGVNFGRDLPEAEVFDIRNVLAGDPSPDGQGTLEICRGIEVGHIFQLRSKYAKALNCSYLDEQGKSQIMEMGCYGIGVSRIVGAAIEQGNDDKGIILPKAIAPFEVCIVPMGYFKSEAVKAAADQLYADLKQAGVDVVLDDRNERPGVMFADMELIGIPHRVVIGERGLKEGQFEYKGRRDAEATMIAQADILATLQGKLCAA